jgi:hypothetical protein
MKLMKDSQHECSKQQQLHDSLFHRGACLIINESCQEYFDTRSRRILDSVYKPTVGSIYSLLVNLNTTNTKLTNQNEAPIPTEVGKESVGMDVVIKDPVKTWVKLCVTTSGSGVHKHLCNAITEYLALPEHPFQLCFPNKSPTA